MFFTDSAHFLSPTLTASSMLVVDAALSSITLTTDMAVLPGSTVWGATDRTPHPVKITRAPAPPWLATIAA